MTVIFYPFGYYSQREQLRTVLAKDGLALYDSGTCGLESSDIVSFTNLYGLLPVSYLYSAKRLQPYGRYGSTVLLASAIKAFICF